MHINAGKNKRILIYGINFSPEPVGIGKYTGELAEYLADSGFDVRVVTAPSYFPQWKAIKNYFRCEQVGKVRVFRCALWVPRNPNGLTRLLHLATFAISSFPIVLSQLRWEPDIIFTVAPAFFCAPASLILKRLSSRKKSVKTYLHIQDFELDAAFELGILKGALIRKLAEKLERSILMRFDYVSTISQAMRQLVIKKGVLERKAVVIPNWIRTSEIYPQSKAQRKLNPYRAELGITKQQVVILYSGSMNKKQGLAIIAESIERLEGKKDYVWVIAGEGPSKQDLIKRIGRCSNVYILPLQPKERMNDWLNFADIHLLPQRTGAADLVLPSKLLGIMASGRPVVACSPVDSELGHFASQVGIRVDPEDCYQMVNAIIRLTSDKILISQCRHTSQEIINEYFDQAKIMKKLIDQFMEFVD